MHFSLKLSIRLREARNALFTRQMKPDVPNGFPATLHRNGSLELVAKAEPQELQTANAALSVSVDRIRSQRRQEKQNGKTATEPSGQNQWTA